MSPPADMPSAEDALARLKEGNARFAKNQRADEGASSPARRTQLVQGQNPFAIILSCADSRVPSELVFDCGLGDLFVVRVAGNVVAPSIVGSIEFAAAAFGTRLVAVVGHSQCGAVKSTVEVLLKESRAPTDNIRDIVSRIAPAVAELDLHGDREAVMHRAVRANVRMSCAHLRHGSALLERLISQGDIAVVGAEYSLETGVVDFFDVPGDPSQSI